MVALNPAVRHARERQVRQSVSQNRNPVARHICESEDQINQRRSQKNQTRQRIQKVRHRVEIAKPLRQRQVRRKQRILDPQNLNHPPRPPDALLHMRRQPLRRQSRRLRNIDVRRVPPAYLHAQAGVRVFCNRLCCNSPDLIQSLAPQHRARTAKECRIPEIVPVLHDPVKQLPFVRNHPKLPQVPLERIGRVKMMRRLQHPQPRIP